MTLKNNKYLHMKYIATIIFILSTLNMNAQVSSKKSKELSEVKIIVYGSDTCHYCIDTKAYLKEKHIDFIYFDVDVNLEKQQEMLVKLQKANISIETLSLPVIDKKGEIFTNGNDFDKFLKKIIK
jgi:glutaredoxin 3